jgi:hypothetical protein
VFTPCATELDVIDKDAQQTTQGINQDFKSYIGLNLVFLSACGWGEKLITLSLQNDHAAENFISVVDRNAHMEAPTVIKTGPHMLRH